MSKKIIARCCVCGGPVYSDGTADCDSEWNPLHEIDVDQEREKFLATTGLSPEEYLEFYNQDNVTSKTIGNYYLAKLLIDKKESEEGE